MIDTEIQNVKVQLRRIRTYIIRESADLNKKARKYNCLPVLTPAEEREVDDMDDRIDQLDSWLDAIDTALSEL